MCPSLPPTHPPAPWPAAPPPPPPPSTTAGTPPVFFMNANKSEPNNRVSAPTQPNTHTHRSPSFPLNTYYLTFLGGSPALAASRSAPCPFSSTRPRKGESRARDKGPSRVLSADSMREMSCSSPSSRASVGGGCRWFVWDGMGGVSVSGVCGPPTHRRAQTRRKARQGDPRHVGRQ